MQTHHTTSWHTAYKYLGTEGVWTCMLTGCACITNFPSPEIQEPARSTKHQNTLWTLLLKNSRQREAWLWHSSFCNSAPENATIPSSWHHKTSLWTSLWTDLKHHWVHLVCWPKRNCQTKDPKRTVWEIKLLWSRYCMHVHKYICSHCYYLLYWLPP